MIRRLLYRRRRPVDPELSAAKRHTAASRTQAARDLRESTARLKADRAVTDSLARHNEANRYDVWLERVLRDAR